MGPLGTNYYWYPQDTCPHCGQPGLRQHIGKSSGGWCFGLHVYPVGDVMRLEDWVQKWQQGVIRDEFGDVVPPSQMLTIITKRSGQRSTKTDFRTMGYRDEADFLEKNQAEWGPSNLLRHRIDGRFCVAHGEGAWDYLVGDFS